MLNMSRYSPSYPRQSYPSYIHINYNLILVRVVFQLIIEVFVSLFVYL